MVQLEYYARIAVDFFFLISVAQECQHNSVRAQRRLYYVRHILLARYGVGIIQ